MTARRRQPRQDTAQLARNARRDLARAYRLRQHAHLHRDPQAALDLAHQLTLRAQHTIAQAAQAATTTPEG